ncbi:MAG: hypothetical protein DI604_31985, partial [Delftia acidovorans]
MRRGNHPSNGPQQKTQGIPMKALVIEDDAETAAYIVGGLEECGWVIDHANTGRTGLFLAADGNYDCLVVDRMLP